MRKRVNYICKCHFILAMIVSFLFSNSLNAQETQFKTESIADLRKAVSWLDKQLFSELESISEWEIVKIQYNEIDAYISINNAGSIFSPAPGNAMLTALMDAYGAIDGVQKCRGETADSLNDGKEYIQVTASGVDGDDVTSNANRVIKNIQTAIDHVSRYRAELGAKQNRLEHTINNLQVTSENTIAAESRIRDTDMAKEMAAYTKNNILSQAAQSMLAQANQSGQGVLSLLQ